MVALDEPPLFPRVDAGNVARLESTSDHPKVCLKAADGALFGVYQDWVHPNPENHLYGGINEDGKWQNRWRKLVYLPIQRYNLPYRQVGKNLVSILLVKLDGIRARKWNANMVITFQPVILQRLRLITGAKKFYAQIEAQLDSWNCCAFDELTKNSYTAAMGYLGKARRTQSVEQCHRTFSNLILRVKFCKAVRFFGERETGGSAETRKTCN